MITPVTVSVTGGIVEERQGWSEVVEVWGQMAAPVAVTTKMVREV